MISIHHIAFNCIDIKKQEEFYSRHFGFKRVHVFNPGTEKEFIILRLGSRCIELFQAKGKIQNSNELPYRFNHIAFEVDSLEEFIKKLKKDGIETEKIIDYSSISEGFRICFLNDPEGNRIELMEGYIDQY